MNADHQMQLFGEPPASSPKPAVRDDPAPSGVEGFLAQAAKKRGVKLSKADLKKLAGYITDAMHLPPQTGKTRRRLSIFHKPGICARCGAKSEGQEPCRCEGKP